MGIFSRRKKVKPQKAGEMLENLLKKVITQHQKEKIHNKQNYNFKIEYGNTMNLNLPE